MLSGLGSLLSVISVPTRPSLIAHQRTDSCHGAVISMIPNAVVRPSSSPCVSVREFDEADPRDSRDPVSSWSAITLLSGFPHTCLVVPPRLPCLLWSNQLVMLECSVTELFIS